MTGLLDYKNSVPNTADIEERMLTCLEYTGDCSVYALHQENVRYGDGIANGHNAQHVCDGATGQE